MIRMVMAIVGVAWIVMGAMVADGIPNLPDANRPLAELATSCMMAAGAIIGILALVRK